jgi:glycosyltransferase involved in cell wall biosynthesis
VTTAEDREPWGLVVNEAMHAGLPVVATDGVGAAAGGLVRDGHNGFVVAEQDRVGLARALATLLDHPDDAATMGERGRADVAAFNYDRMADAFVSAAEFAVKAKAAGSQARVPSA